MSKVILLHNGLEAIVDDEDYERLSKYKWTALAYDQDMPKYRAVRHTGNKKTRRAVYMHREIMNIPGGLSGQHVDHINHDGLDNRKQNLRIATKAQNRQNATKGGDFNGKPCTSKLKGVSIAGRGSKKWSARICSNKEKMIIGYYDTQEEAARAYDEAALKYFGEFASLNFPIGDKNV